MSILDLFRSLSKPKPTLLIKGDPVVPDWSWYQASDPSVVNINGQWRMFFTSIQGYKLHICEAVRPAGKGIVGEWTFTGPVVSPNLGFDAVETPSYFSFAKNGQLIERIYFTQWTRDAYNYSIGCAEKIGNSWVQYAGPVLKAENDWEKVSLAGLVRKVLARLGRFMYCSRVSVTKCTSFLRLLRRFFKSFWVVPTGTFLSWSTCGQKIALLLLEIDVLKLPVEVWILPLRGLDTSSIEKAGRESTG